MQQETLKCLVLNEYKTHKKYTNRKQATLKCLIPNQYKIKKNVDVSASAFLRIKDN